MCRVKLKASSEKVCQFMVEMVMSCMKDAPKMPSAPTDQPKEQGFEDESR